MPDSSLQVPTASPPRPTRIRRSQNEKAKGRCGRWDGGSALPPAASHWIAARPSRPRALGGTEVLR
eukprot:1261406-Pyramimonas_sp.AAC.1